LRKLKPLKRFLGSLLQLHTGLQPGVDERWGCTLRVRVACHKGNEECSGFGFKTETFDLFGFAACCEAVALPRRQGSVKKRWATPVVRALPLFNWGKARTEGIAHD